jgi:hypothetical protein
LTNPASKKIKKTGESTPSSSSDSSESLSDKIQVKEAERQNFSLIKKNIEGKKEQNLKLTPMMQLSVNNLEMKSVINAKIFKNLQKS